ncbi:MAG: hypothetical protein PSV22_06125, partial [Pseudolabrys sp.]|nr:hypothetical protein [Pseudolabrys sp.]
RDVIETRTVQATNLHVLDWFSAFLAPTRSNSGPVPLVVRALFTARRAMSSGLAVGWLKSQAIDRLLEFAGAGSIPRFGKLGMV